MNRYILIFLMAIALVIPGYTQKKEEKSEPAKTEKKEEEKKDEKADKGKKDEKLTDSIYNEVILENFEETKYDKTNIKYAVTRDQTADVQVKEEYPAPTGKSKKYLGVKVVGKNGDVFTIKPTKDLLIDKHCKAIYVWVYGKNFTGELSLLIKDSAGKIHRKTLGKINFLGWRKLTVNIENIKQQDEYLNQKKFIQITEIQYRPGNWSEQPLLQYFYIDDISAMVREKYTDRQSDDW